jgi:hypothetical protein
MIQHAELIEAITLAILDNENDFEITKYTIELTGSLVVTLYKDDLQCAFEIPLDFDPEDVASDYIEPAIHALLNNEN